MLQLVLDLYGFCHATELAYRLAGVKYGVRTRGHRNAGGRNKERGD
jgi:hypothetical protein